MVPAIEYLNNRDGIIILHTPRQLRHHFCIRQDILNTNNMRYNNYKSYTILIIYISLLILSLTKQVTGAQQQNWLSREISERCNDAVNLASAIPHILFLFLGARELISNYLYDIMYGLDREYIFWEIGICLFFASCTQYIRIIPGIVPPAIQGILVGVPFSNKLSIIARYIRPEPQGHNGSPLFSILYRYFSDTAMVCVRSLHYMISSHIITSFGMYVLWRLNLSNQHEWVIRRSLVIIIVCLVLSIHHNIMLYAFYSTLAIYYLVKLPDLFRSIYMYHTNPDICKLSSNPSYKFVNPFQISSIEWPLYIKRYSDIALGIADDIEFLPFIYDHALIIFCVSQILFMAGKYSSSIFFIILELLSRIAVIGLLRIVFLASLSSQMLSDHKSVLEPSLIILFLFIPLVTLRFTYRIEYPRVVYTLFLSWMYYNQESIERWLGGRYIWIDTPIKLLIILLVIIESKIGYSVGSIIILYEQFLIYLYYSWYKDIFMLIFLEAIALSRLFLTLSTHPHREIIVVMFFILLASYPAYLTLKAIAL